MDEPQFAPFEPLPPPRATSRWVTWLVICAAVLVFLVVVAPYLERPRGNTLTACRSNLKNIGTALEMYSTDNQGRYPKRLELLVGNYLKAIPTCPAAQGMTYIDYRCATYPDAYTVHCAGDNHAKSYGSRAPTANYPGYSSYAGLIEPK